MKKKMLFLISGIMLIAAMSVSFQSSVLANDETDHLYEMPPDGSGGSSAFCKGSTCEKANGLNYGYNVKNGICCGVARLELGQKKS